MRRGARGVEEHQFHGSAMTSVDAKGRLSLPSFVRGVIERRSGNRTAFLGKQEAQSCLIGYDSTVSRILAADNERRRLQDELAGIDITAHQTRQRRTFGLTEEVNYDPSGRVVMPPLLRRKGRIEDFALFVGGGRDFEIWNPHVAFASDDEDLRDIAAFHMDEKGVKY